MSKVLTLCLLFEAFCGRMGRLAPPNYGVDGAIMICGLERWAAVSKPTN